MYRRGDVGDIPKLCSHCMTEIDVPEPKHDPKCVDFIGTLVSEAPVAKRSAKPKKAPAEGTRTDGSLRAAETNRRIEAATVMTIKCGVEGCDWPGFTGSTIDARAAQQAHRDEAHRDARRRTWKGKRETDQQIVERVALTDKEEQMDDGITLDPAEGPGALDELHQLAAENTPLIDPGKGYVRMEEFGEPVEAGPPFLRPAAFEGLAEGMAEALAEAVQEQVSPAGPESEPEAPYSETEELDSATPIHGGRAIAFMYVMLRDELTGGRLNKIILDLEKNGNEVYTFSDSLLAAKAIELNARVRGNTPEEAARFAAEALAHAGVRPLHPRP